MNISKLGQYNIKFWSIKPKNTSSSEFVDQVQEPESGNSMRKELLRLIDDRSKNFEHRLKKIIYS